MTNETATIADVKQEILRRMFDGGDLIQQYAEAYKTLCEAERCERELINQAKNKLPSIQYS